MARAPIHQPQQLGYGFGNGNRRQPIIISSQVDQREDWPGVTVGFLRVATRSLSGWKTYQRGSPAITSPMKQDDNFSLCDC